MFYTILTIISRCRCVCRYVTSRYYNVQGNLKKDKIQFFEKRREAKIEKRKRTIPTVIIIVSKCLILMTPTFLPTKDAIQVNKSRFTY